MSFLTKFDRYLSGWPEELLTVTLIVIGVFSICIGIFAPASIKAFWLAYEVLP